jgi:hypothetical protein
MNRFGSLLLVMLAGCGDADPMSQPDLASPPDLRPACASAFGSALTNAFGRLDGTVRAVVPPADPECAKPNGTHLVLQVDSGGETYRMVVNVESDRAGQDQRVSAYELDAALPTPAFADGWHAGLALDYAQALNAHSTQFTAKARDALVSQISAQLMPGAPVSVYATSSGGDSAHLVHRNNGLDGAIVVNPKTTPHWLLFRFVDQVF